MPTDKYCRYKKTNEIMNDLRSSFRLSNKNCNVIFQKLFSYIGTPCLRVYTQINAQALT